MEKIIDQISINALDILYSRNIFAEHHRNFTVYCNKDVYKKIKNEIIKDQGNIPIIKENSTFKKEDLEDEILYGVNGLKIKFKIDDNYKILTIVFDTYPLINKDE